MLQYAVQALQLLPLAIGAQLLLTVRQRHHRLALPRPGPNTGACNVAPSEISIIQVTQMASMLHILPDILLLNVTRRYQKAFVVTPFGRRHTRTTIGTLKAQQPSWPGVPPTPHFLRIHVRVSENAVLELGYS